MDPREREKQEEKARERKALLDRAYDRVISSQLSKLASKKTVTGECWIYLVFSAAAACVSREFSHFSHHEIHEFLTINTYDRG